MKAMPKRQIKVTVNQDDVDHGVKGASAGCMVQRAVQRTLRQLKLGATGVRVDEHTIDMTVDNVRYQFLTPNAARVYLINYDAGLPVAPFKFHLLFKRALVRPAAINNRGQFSSESARRAGRTTRRAKAAQAAETTGAVHDIRGAAPIRGATRRTREDRRYGARALFVNQARVATGDLAPAAP